MALVVQLALRQTQPACSRFDSGQHHQPHSTIPFFIMAEYSIITRHKDNMAFEAEIGNHKIIMDTVADGGGADSGPPPKKLLLSTLATCTGMDIVSLLKKMRVEYTDFDIVTDADLTEEHPKVFSNILITYRIKVDRTEQEKVEKAVALSQDKYCGISAMLRKNSPLEYRIEYL